MSYTAANELVEFLLHFLLDRIASNRLVCAFVSRQNPSNLPLRLDLQAVQ